MKTLTCVCDFCGGPIELMKGGYYRIKANRNRIGIYLQDDKTILHKHIKCPQKAKEKK